MDRTVFNNTGGSHGRTQTIGVFLPECENLKPSRTQLATMFEEQKDPASDTKVAVGKLSNQIVIMKIASLMPVRFVESLTELKRHYDGLLTDSKEAVLLHGEGDGKKLPPLFARSAVEVKAQTRRKPFVLIARLLSMVKERQNKTTGLMEWVFTYIANGLPKVVVLKGKTWRESVLEGEHPAEVQRSIEKEVAKRRVDAEYKHVDRKIELRDVYQKLVFECFEVSGEDDQDPEFLALERDAENAAGDHRVALAGRLNSHNRTENTKWRNTNAKAWACATRPMQQKSSTGRLVTTGNVPVAAVRSSLWTGLQAEVGGLAVAAGAVARHR